MKKLFLFVFMLSLFTVLVFPGTISVLEPRAGKILNAGQTFVIKWKSSGNTSGVVAINIFRNSINKNNKVEQLKGKDTGSLRWTISTKYSTGNYILRIRNGNGTLKGDSGVFKIRTNTSPPPPPVKPSITVSSPTGGEIVNAGRLYTIKWKKTGTQHRAVQINVFKDTISQANIVEKLTGPNSESLLWNIKSNYSSGKYILRIRTGDGKVNGDSKVFNIKGDSSIVPVEPKDKGPIKIPYPGSQPSTKYYVKTISPKQGQTVYLGSQVTIKWIYSGFASSGNVCLYLLRRINKHTTATERHEILKSTPISSRSYTFKLDPNLPEGEYFIIADYIKVPGARAVVELWDPPLHSGPFKVKRNSIVQLSPVQQINTTENTIQLNEGIIRDNNTLVLQKDVIKEFRTTPETIEPEQHSVLVFDYKNAVSAEILNVNTGKVERSLGAMTARKETHAVYPKETTTYRLVVNTSSGNVTKDATVIIKGDMYIVLFAASDKYPKPGEKVELYYNFQGADYASIYEVNSGKFITSPSIGGKYKVNGKYTFTYKHPVKFKLAISKNGGKESQEKTVDISVDSSLKGHQGIKTFKITPNWRFAETHVDFEFEVMGAKSISIYRHNNFGKTLRRYHVNLSEYKLYKNSKKPFDKVPSKDFAKTYHYQYKVVFWDGSEKTKSFVWQ